MDGLLDDADADNVANLIKSNSAAKSYYKGLLAAQKQVKRLEHKAAFLEFAERWPRRVRTEHEKMLMRKRTIRIASSVAAVTAIAFVGIGMLRAGLHTQSSMTSSVSEDSANTMMAKEAAPTEALLMESAPAMAGAADTEAADSSMADEAASTPTPLLGEYPLPANAFVIHPTEGTSEAMYEALLALTEGQDEQPLSAPFRVMLVITEENQDAVFGLLNEQNIDYTGLETGMAMVLIYPGAE